MHPLVSRLALAAASTLTARPVAAQAPTAWAAASAKVLVHSVETDTIDAAFIDLVRRNGTILVPTLTVREGYAHVFLGRSPAARRPALPCRRVAAAPAPLT